MIRLRLLIASCLSLSACVADDAPIRVMSNQEIACEVISAWLLDYRTRYDFGIPSMVMQSETFLIETGVRESDLLRESDVSFEYIDFTENMMVELAPQDDLMLRRELFPVLRQIWNEPVEDHNAALGQQLRIEQAEADSREQFNLLTKSEDHIQTHNWVASTQSEQQSSGFCTEAQLTDSGAVTIINSHEDSQVLDQSIPDVFPHRAGARVMRDGRWYLSELEYHTIQDFIFSNDKRQVLMRINTSMSGEGLYWMRAGDEGDWYLHASRNIVMY